MAGVGEGTRALGPGFVFLNKVGKSAMCLHHLGCEQWAPHPVWGAVVDGDLVLIAPALVLKRAQWTGGVCPGGGCGPHVSALPWVLGPTLAAERAPGGL